MGVSDKNIVLRKSMLNFFQKFSISCKFHGSFGFLAILLRIAYIIIHYAYIICWSEKIPLESLETVKLISIRN